MNVISKKALRTFYLDHPQAERPLLDWYGLMRRNRFENLNALRAIYPHADLAKSSDGTVLTVFNIAGNRYRVVTLIRYERQTVYIKRVFTHAQYDHWNQRRRPL